MKTTENNHGAKAMTQNEAHKIASDNLIAATEWYTKTGPMGSKARDSARQAIEDAEKALKAVMDGILTVAAPVKASKAQAYDNLHNEGNRDSYNPYRN